MAQQEPRTNRKHSESVAHESADILAERIAWVGESFPEAVSEGKVDFDRLRTALGDVVESQRERYGLNWAGKRDCIQLLQTTSKGTLVPVPEESVGFENSGNVFIEGENLEVLKLLYKAYFGRVKMIYIDPPYNTGQDFIYSDDYADPLDAYLRLTGQKDAAGNLLTSNPESSGRYHSRWLSMMYPRLFVARQLLTDDGVIFVSIDDHEVHNLRMIMNEVFGEENFIAVIVVQSNKRGQTYKEIAQAHEYLVIYGKGENASIGEIAKSGNALPYQDSKGPFDLWELRNRNPKFGRRNRPNLYYPIFVAPKIHDECGYAKVSLEKSEDYYMAVFPQNSEGKDGCWRWSRDRVRHSDLASPNPQVVARQRQDGGWNVYQRSRRSTTRVKSIWDDTAFISEQGTIQLGELGLSGVFDHPKPVGLVRRCMEIATEGEDLIVDFFGGCATTAQAAFELNCIDEARRRFVVVELPEPIAGDSPAHVAGFNTTADVAKERIRRVIGRQQADQDSRLPLHPVDSSPDLGFRVFRLQRSSIEPWKAPQDSEPDFYAAQLQLHVDPLTDGWKPDHVIWEVALKEGWGLDSRLEAVAAVSDCTVHRVTSADGTRSFLICLDDPLSLDALRPLGLKQEDLFICRDCALTDESAANLALQCRLKTI